MGNPTLHDVARVAGVSYSTADRVLNGRGGVASKSIERVRQAIEDLGYRRDITAANLSRRRSYRFAVCVPQGDHGFFSSIRRAFLAEAEARHTGEEIPRPPHWGGFRVVPDAIEFWQDRAHRLHERRLFTRQGDAWREGLLFP